MWTETAVPISYPKSQPKLQKAKPKKDNLKSHPSDIFWAMDQAVTDLQVYWSYLFTSGSSNFVLSFGSSFIGRHKL